MPETRTIEQAEHTVETVEHTEYQCPNCSQWFENDELHDVEIDGTETILCSGCGDAVFDVDDDPSGIETETSDSDTTGTSGTVNPVSLVVVGVVLFTAFQVMSDVIGSVDSAELQQASEQVVTGTTGDVFGLFGVALTVLFLVVIAGYMSAIGPRY
jgi:DNA-directed RNA polymerase subunit RPC12/RpoP